MRLSTAVTNLSFAAGVAGALLFSYIQLAPVVERYGLIPSMVSNATTVYDFQCRDADCAQCLQGLASTSGALVMTSGSSMRRGLDLPRFAQAMPMPMVDCMRNDTRVDAYRIFFTHRPVLESSDTVFHGYNSWAVNSPGTWRDASAASFFADAPSSRRTWTVWDSLQQYRLLAQIFLVNTLSGSAMEWRTRFRLRVPLFDSWEVPYWPLSREAHQSRRIELMRRWFAISPYARSFVIDADRVSPRDDIERRHEAFIAALAPARRIVFVPSPEMPEVFPARLQRVFTESRQILVDLLAKHPAIRHVDIDYAACGVVPTDFWAESAMVFDVAHNHPSATPKITECVIAAMQRAGVPAFLAEK